MRTVVERSVVVAAAALLLGQLGCAFPMPGDAAVQRASREFSCPPAKIGVIERSDIADSLFDLEACGHRARYSCFYNDPYGRGYAVIGETGRNQCIREPDPDAWSPDPQAIASMPAPESGVQTVRSSPGLARRICGPAPSNVRSEQTYEGPAPAPPRKDCITLRASISAGPRHH